MKKYLFIVLLVGVAFSEQYEKVITKWSNGTARKIHYYEGKGFDEVLVGVKTYYSNGDIRSKNKYKNNVRHGEYLFYLEGNELLIQGGYVNGEPKVGSWIVYKPYEIKSRQGTWYFKRKLERWNVEFSIATDYIINLEWHDNGEPKKYQGSIKLREVSEGESMYPDIGKSYTWYENGMIEVVSTDYAPGSDCFFENILFYDTGEKKDILNFVMMEIMN
tara:strand:+ start:260 stop:913 length:654 start_codon:yes stop_codon:yes gene_type:complete